MSGRDRVRVSRSLYRSALIDAIESTEELVRGGGGDEHARRRLTRYRQALTAIGGGLPEPEGHGVPISEVKPSDQMRLPYGISS